MNRESTEQIGQLHVVRNAVEVELYDAKNRKHVEALLQAFGAIAHVRRKGEPKFDDAGLALNAEKAVAWAAYKEKHGKLAPEALQFKEAHQAFAKELAAFDAQWAAKNPVKHRTIRMVAPSRLDGARDGELQAYWRTLLGHAEALEGQDVCAKVLWDLGSKAIHDAFGFHRWASFFAAYR